MNTTEKEIRKLTLANGYCMAGLDILQILMKIANQDENLRGLMREIDNEFQKAKAFRELTGYSVNNSDQGF